MPPEEEQQQQEESSIRDDFEASIAAIENDDAGAVTTETKASEDEQPITAEDLNSDDGEKEAEAKAKAKVEAEAGKATEQAAKPGDAEGTTDSEADGGADTAESGSKAPESWSPAAREAWKDVPESARAQITKREGEINKALNDGAEHRKTGEQFQGIADRYAQIFAAEGAPDPITGIEELIKTVTTLRMGSAQQKAEKVAGFIQHYGIDVGTLDDILSGTISGKPAEDPNDPMTKMLNERLKPVDDLLSRMDQQRRSTQFQQNQDAINEVVTFKQTAEFYEDVKNDMADMVELADARGVKMPLQEAYDKACALNPQISEVLTKRLNDEKLLNNGKTLEEKRNAASSITGKQGGNATVDTDSMSMRQTLEAGFDAQVG